MSLLDKTNLLITPNAVKAGKLYSVIPSSGTGDCTVVRNTAATYFNSSMILTTALANVPRLNYNTVDGIPFILDEPQGTNIVNFSESLENSFYSKIRSSVAANAGLSPRGTNNANKIITSVDNSTHRCDFTTTLNNGSPYVYSIFAKKAEFNCIQIAIGDFAVQNNFSNFNLNTGVNTNVGASTSLMIALPNGWYRCIVFLSLSSYNAQRVAMGVGNNDVYSFAGNASSGIFAFGSDLKQSSNLTSYIPAIAAASVTRNADVITVAPPVGTVKITTTFSNDTTEVITSIPTTFTVPEGLIKQVLMQSSL